MCVSLLTPVPQNEDNTGTLDAQEHGILDLMATKAWAIKLATEASRTVLAVDQIIVARQAGGPKPPGPNPVSKSSSLYCIESCLLRQSATNNSMQNWDED